MSLKQRQHSEVADSSSALVKTAVNGNVPISHEDYKAQLRALRIELVKLQRHFMRCGDSILVLLEGRDAAGKDGSIKRIVEDLSPRETRVVALGKPSDRDLRGWYFQRYVAHLRRGEPGLIDQLRDTAIEPFDHPIGLRVARRG